LYYLNVDCLFWKGLLLFLEETNRLEECGDYGFLSNKKKRERKRKEWPKRKGKLSPFSSIPEIIFSSFSFP
jgi:hypothetical protein